MTTSSPSFFSLARRSFWLLFGGIWLLAGVFMLLFAVVFAFREQDFAANGVVTTGMVLEKRIDPADSDSSTQYRVSYRFTTADGRVVEGSDGVDVAVWEGLTERGPIEVRYLRDQPSTNRLSSESDFFGAVIFFLAAVIFGGIGGFLFFRALRGVRKARRLLDVGVPASATVTGVAETNVSYNRRQQFKVRYSYADGKGATHEGESGYMDFAEAGMWHEGDVARIRYDPDRPEESHWLGASDGAPDERQAGSPIVPPTPVDAPPPTARAPIDAPPPVDAPPPA